MQKRLSFKEIYSMLLFNNKKGQMAKGKVTALIGALIFIVMVSALGPSMFVGLNITGSPSFVGQTLPVIVGGGLILMVWSVFS